MKFAISISISFLMSCLLFSCTKSKYISKALDTAEAIMQIQPDSALRILQNLDGQNISQEAFQARFALLYTMALDKNYLPLHGDSLINIAIDYYSRKKEFQRLGWCYLYLGNAYVQIDSTVQAMFAYLKTQEILQHVDDDYLLGLVANEIASLHQEQRNYEQALILFRQSLKAFQRVGNKKNEGYVLSKIGRLLYISGGQIDSVQYFYDTAKKLAIEGNDLEFLYVVSASQAAILRAQNQSTMARQLLLSVIQEYHQGVVHLDLYPLLSLIYIDLQQLDSSRHYLQLLLQDNRATAKQRAGALTILKRVEEQAGNFEAALHYSNRYKVLSDSIVQKHNAQNLPYTEQKYQVEKLSKENLIQKNRFWVIIAILTLSTITCTFGFYYLWKRRTTRMKRQYAETITQQQESIKEIRRLSLSENWNVALFVKEFEPCSIFPTEQAFFAKALKVANLAYPQLTEWLKKHYPHLSESDTVLTCLLLSGYRPKHLCRLFNVPDIRTMHSRCSRLYKRLGVKTDPKDPLSFKDGLIHLFVLDELS